MSERGEMLMGVVFVTALGTVLVLSALNGLMYPAMTSLVGMVVITIPLLLYRKRIFHLPWAVTLAAGSVLVLHSIGIVFGFYDLLWWWDTMTHFMATIIIALIISLALMSADRVIRNFMIPPHLVPVVTVSGVILFGVIWEVLEFIFDGALGLNMQYSLDDTATDLTFDLLGGGLVALASVPLLGLIEKTSREMFLRSTDPSADR